MLDECDFIAKARNSGKDIGEVHRIVNTLLQLLEDYDLPGLVVATTNLYDQLDHALFRRFDDVINVPVPGLEERIELLKTSTVGLKIKPKSIEWEDIGNRLEGMSAANVVSISQNACKLSVLSNSSYLEQAHFDLSMKAFKRLI